MFSTDRDVVRLQNMEQEILNDFSDEESAIYQAYCPRCEKRATLDLIKQNPTLPVKFLQMTPAQRRKTYSNSTPEQWVAVAVASMLLLKRTIVLIQLLDSHQTMLNSPYQELPAAAHRFLDELYHRLSDINI